MTITHYSADVSVEHSFFGKARMGSFEPVENLCHRVAKELNYPEADKVKLIEIVHSAVNRFFEQYPKTRARIVCIRLSVGSSVKSLGLSAAGYFASGFASFGPMRPTGDIIKAETDLFIQEFKQYFEELRAANNEKAQRFWTDLQVEAVATNPDPLDVQREFIEPNAAMFAQRIQRTIYLKLVDRVAELITPKLIDLPGKTGLVHLELKVADKAIVDFLNSIESVEVK